MSSIPQIATQEISETDLDNVSGGDGAWLSAGIDSKGAWVSGGVSGLVPAELTLTGQGSGGIDTSAITGLIPTL
ncbi:type A2 lantipeptide [Streptomyces sp. NPDC002577]